MSSMEFPASYLLALSADQHRMNSARLDAPTEAPTAHRPSLRAVLRWIATHATRPALIGRRTTPRPAATADLSRTANAAGAARQASGANVACGA
jgi:hypothetical protein